MVIISTKADETSSQAVSPLSMAGGAVGAGAADWATAAESLVWANTSSLAPAHVKENIINEAAMIPPYLLNSTGNPPMLLNFIVIVVRKGDCDSILQLKDHAHMIEETTEILCTYS